MAKRAGTYLVAFNDGSEIIFGNNYKPWWQHAIEYTYSKYGNRDKGWRYSDVADVVVTVAYSTEPFYDDGGLKWCAADAYQDLVDDLFARVAVQAPKVMQMNFIPDSASKGVLTKKLKAY